MSERIHIKAELLEWARERAGISMDALCDRFVRYPEWLSGEREPTLKQVESFAAATFAPLGYLFLDSPPKESLPFPDFRTVTDRQIPRPSPHLLDTIHAVQRRQEWMREFLLEEGEEPLEFIGSRTLRDSPVEVAAEIRETLGLNAQWTRHLRTWEEALRRLVQKIEEVGVMVMINGVVENNTRRPLDVGEFRGFVLSDPYAPAIFINGRDAKAAQMFTLVHELAHLWLGKGGLSDCLEPSSSAHRVELFCNHVAAEVLVPKQEMTAVWDELEVAPDRFDRLARRFKVSPVVAARRALDMELISREAYFAFYRDYQAEAEKRRTKGSGGDFYRTLGSRLGKRFPAAVYVAAKEGRLGYREAYQLTGLSGVNYDRFGKKFGFAL